MLIELNDLQQNKNEHKSFRKFCKFVQDCYRLFFINFL